MQSLLVTLLAGLLIIFHPLSKYPGPLLWRLTRLPYMLAFRSGRLSHKLKEFHETYGEIVRVAPNELSFTNPEAPRDIYQKQSTPTGGSRQALPKDPVRFPPPQPGMPISILDALDEDHARIRKAWSSSFSTAALQQQEPLVISYVDKMIAQLKTRASTPSQPVDLQTWYSYCTFDIIGALSFGDDFGCLENDRYHEWVAGLVYSIKAKVQIAACRFYPQLYQWLVKWSTSPQAKAAMMKHMTMAREKVTSRVAAGSTNPHPDFLSQVQKAELSEAELVTNSATMIFAGSHTLQTTLSGLTYFLLRNPDSLAKASAEIRAAFASESDLSLRKLAELPYLNAVIMEGFRMTSPVPLNMTRIIPEGGATVVGEYLGAGTIVGYMSWAANYSPRNFADPQTFAPERWLAEGQVPAMYKGDCRGANLPFLTGPRDCLGQNLARMEILHILGRMPWHFDMSVSKDGPQIKRWEDQETYAVWVRTPLPVLLKVVQ